MPDRIPELPEYLDSTMRSAFVSCPMKFYNEFVLRLAPAEKSIHLVAGGAIASALEAARNAYYAEGKSLTEARYAAFAAHQRGWEDWPIDGDYSNAKNPINTWASLDDPTDGYFTRYPLDRDHIKPAHHENGRPAIEFSFAVPLPVEHPVTGHPFLYCGRFDMLGETAGACWVVDEKTTGRSFPANWVDQWKLRGQFLGYTWAARQHGYNCQGAIVRGILIQKTQIKHLETPPMSIPEWMIVKWYQQLVADTKRLVECWNTGHWDQSFGDACSSYNGCPYVELCTAREPEMWYGDFADRNWNPLHKDPTDGDRPGPAVSY